MGLFKYQQGSLYMMQLLIIKLVCGLGWLSAIALGQLQLSESISGSVSFPELGLTCLANLAVFFWSFLRGRLYSEMGAKDALTFLTGPIKLKKINGWEDNITNGFAFTTCGKKDLSDCCVVMLSHETPNSSMRQFVEYIANVHHVRSVLLHYLPLDSAPSSLLSTCNCGLAFCECIVFWAPEDVTVMVAEQIPRTLKRLSDSLCLLPSNVCLTNGCHGCNQGLLHVEDHFVEKKLKEGSPVTSPIAAVCEISYLSTFRNGDPATCICIPVPQEDDDSDRRNDDRWTKLLIGCFRFKDYEIRSVIVRQDMGNVSGGLENYMARNGTCDAAEEYSVAALIVPRLTEILINLVLVIWFKMDGLSSALVARRAIKAYIVDGGARGFAAHVFMNKAEVRSNDANTNAFQALTFRDNVWNPKALSVMAGIVNLACSVTWVVLVALEGGSNKWYHTHSMPPSKGRLLVIFVGIAIALALDCVDLYLYLDFDLYSYFANARDSFKRWLHSRRKTLKEEMQKVEEATLCQELEEARREEKREEIQEKRAETQEKIEEMQKIVKAVREKKREEKREEIQEKRAEMQEEIEEIWRQNRRAKMIVCTMIVFQILCIVSSSIVAREVGIKAFGRWVYSAVQGLVWAKWGIGTYLLGQYVDEKDLNHDFNHKITGKYMLSSAFFLNAILAGVRAKWEFF